MALEGFYCSHKQLNWLSMLAQYELTFLAPCAPKLAVTHVSRSYFHVSSHTKFKTSC